MANTPTLEQVHAAMQAVNDALQDNTISEEMEDALNELCNVLQGMEDAIIQDTEEALVNALVGQNEQLQALNKKINDLACNLDTASEKIKSVSTTVGTIVSIVAALV